MGDLSGQDPTGESSAWLREGQGFTPHLQCWLAPAIVAEADTVSFPSPPREWPTGLQGCPPLSQSHLEVGVPFTNISTYP